MNEILKNHLTVKNPSTGEARDMLHIGEEPSELTRYDLNFAGNIYITALDTIAALRARVGELERIEKIARTIFDVVDTGVIFRTAKACPHGNYATPPYNHPWWCDNCWNELKEALAAALAQGVEK